LKLSKFFFTIILIAFVCKTFSQEIEDTTQRKNNIAAFPIVFYLPETNFGFGLASIITYRNGNKNGVKPSQFQVVAVYTLRKQILLYLPYEIYTQKDKNRISGELGFYKYYYNYFGQGNKSKLKDLEIFDVVFPRVEISYLRTIHRKIYVGGQYKYDYFDIRKIETGGLLDKSNIEGKFGGVASTIGLEFLYDTRPELFSPQKGVYFDLKSDISSKYTGADFTYQKIEMDVRKFISTSDRTVLALNLYSGISFGKIPFFKQYYISDGNSLRGYADRRFQDNNMIVLQGEYRFPLYKKFNAVVFGGGALLSPTISSLFNGPIKYSFGPGLRYMLNQQDKINIRADYAFTPEGSNLYLTLKEAF
jgi:outer membrane protein assembly factor BamA